MEWNRIIEGDCLQVMRSLPDKVVDLVVTSPPYNLRLTTGKSWNCVRNDRVWRNGGEHPLKNGFDGHGDKMPHDQYVAWQRECLAEMWRCLSDDGAIFFNHKWRVQAGLHQGREDIVVGLPVRQIIIWDRGGGINHNPGYFVPCYEVIYLIAKPAFRLAPHAPRHSNIWRIVPDRYNPHPAPFPLKLAQRCVSSTEARTVLDPFIGSGTTAVAALRAGRQYLGIEQSAKYCQMARERIAAERSRPFLVPPEGDEEESCGLDLEPPS